MSRLVVILAAAAIAALAVIVWLLRGDPEGFGLPAFEDDTPWMEGWATFSELERNTAA